MRSNSSEPSDDGSGFWFDDEIMLVQMHVGNVRDSFLGVLEPELAGVDAKVGERLGKPLPQKPREATVAAAGVEDPW